MPRLIEQAYGTGTGATSWGYITLGSTADGVYRNVPSKTRLTTIRINFSGWSDASNIDWGLSEDTAGNWPLTGLHEETVANTKLSVAAKGCISVNLDMDYIVTSNATSAGKVYLWYKNDGSDTPTITAFLSYSEV